MPGITASRNVEAPERRAHASIVLISVSPTSQPLASGLNPHRSQLAGRVVHGQAAGHAHGLPAQERDDVVRPGHGQACSPPLLAARVPVFEPGRECVRRLGQGGEADVPPQRPVVGWENPHAHHAASLPRCVLARALQRHGWIRLEGVPLPARILFPHSGIRVHGCNRPQLGLRETGREIPVPRMSGRPVAGGVAISLGLGRLED